MSLLSRANARGQRLLQDSFTEAGVRPLHYRVLAALDEHGDLSQVELGRQVGLDRKDVATTLDALVARDLVRRTPDPADGRRNIVVLTDAARALLPELDRILGVVQRELLAPLTVAERRNLLDLLGKLSAG